MDTEFLDRNVGDNSLVITNDIRVYLRETAKWAKFLSILGFIFIGLMVIGSIFMGSFMTSMASDFGGSPGMMDTGFFTAYFIVMALISIIPVLYLYRFATKIKLALESDNQDVLSEGFRNLKSYYKFIGIIMAIIMGLYAILIAFGLLAAVMS